MEQYSKKIKRQLRELSWLAYQREQEAILANFEQQFIKWREGKIDCEDLMTLIHQFHDYDARELYKELYKKYVMTNDHVWIVTAAIKHKILKKEEVPDVVMEAIGGFMNAILGHT